MTIGEDYLSQGKIAVFLVAGRDRVPALVLMVPKAAIRYHQLKVRAFFSFFPKIFSVCREDTENSFHGTS